VVQVKPDRIYPNSQEWHESSVDDILYIPYFSAQSYASRKANGTLPSIITKKQEKKRNQSAKNDKEEKLKKTLATKAKSTSSANPEKRGPGRPKKQISPESDKSDEDESGKSDIDKDESEVEEEDEEGEFVFASREDSQGEIIVWDASKSTAEDAEIKTILEWSIAESWTKFTLAENMVPSSLLPSVTAQMAKRGRGRGRGRGQPSGSRGRGGRGGAQANNRDDANSDASIWDSWAAKRQNTLVAGSTDGKIVLYDLGVRPKLSKGNVVAQKPTKIISHPDSTELFRDVAVSQDLRTIVTGDWNNRVLIWNKDTE